MVRALFPLNFWLKMSEKNSAPQILTFGCRLNSFESQIMQTKAKRAGLKNIIIVNSCAVTSEAVRQTRQAIRRAKRENPNKKIIVSGCAAQIEAENFAKMSEVDLVIGNADKLKEETYQNLLFDTPGKLSEKIRVNDIMSVKESASHLISGMDGRARAFVEVQNGCDHRCTFCIIPFGRGPSRSSPMGQIIEQIKILVANGYNEIVLTGVDISSYGADLPGNITLGKLVQQILINIPNLPRLRISSIDVAEIDGALFDAFASERRLMAHLHLSIQSGDNLILKRMKRRHNYDDIINLTERFRKIRKEMVFGADIIVGFPTESDEMFENSLKIVKQANISFLHVFPYSKREGTPAAKIPHQVPKNIIKQRAKILRQLGQEQFAKLCASKIGQIENILVERKGIGRSEQFIAVKFSGAKQGDIVKVKITGAEKDGLRGELVGDVK